MYIYIYIYIYVYIIYIFIIYIYIYYIYVIRMMSRVHTLVCHPYVTPMYLYVFRMSLVCGFTINPLEVPGVELN